MEERGREGISDILGLLWLAPGCFETQGLRGTGVWGSWGSQGQEPEELLMVALQQTGQGKPRASRITEGVQGSTSLHTELGNPAGIRGCGGSKQLGHSSTPAPERCQVDADAVAWPKACG